MFLNIKALLHKIHPYFCQYTAYLRNMGITKKETLVSTELGKAGGHEPPLFPL